ncbi:hypothetical protein [Dongia sp.]|uniref:hypothetical protein n=1 Tax=Dongia sp. TaxID=1977262 RepID=UPI0035B0B128
MTFKKLAAATVLSFMCASGAAFAQSASETAPSDTNVIQPAPSMQNDTPLTTGQCDGEKGTSQACDNNATNSPEELNINTGAGAPSQEDPATYRCDNEKGDAQNCTDGNSNTN